MHVDQNSLTGAQQPQAAHWLRNSVLLNRTKVQSNKAMARSLAQSRLGGQGSRTVSMQVSVIGRNCTVPFGVMNKNVEK